MSLFKQHRDLLVSLFLLMLLGVMAAFAVNFSIPPFEDAAMLMRYADHLAHGYGIVWNIGGPPVDGATDFLFMASVAGLMKLGLPLGRAVRALGLGSVAALVLLVYWINRRLWRAPWALATLSAAYLAVGTGLTYVAAYFGTPFFALFAAVTWSLSLLIMESRHVPARLSLLFALCGLVTGLVRPEGVILSALMMASIIVVKGWRRSTTTLGIFVGLFLILGGIYFAWRWSYFGYPLPNPFYKKGGGVLHWDGLQASLTNVVSLCGVFLLPFVIGFRSSRTARKTIAMLVPVTGFSLAFILVSNETNFGGRFQYALLPIVLLSWFPPVAGLDREIGLRALPGLDGRRRAFLIGALAIICLVILSTSFRQGASIDYARDGRYDMAEALQPFASRGYTMVTTEAGLLPLYSQWRSVDAWGLNDPWIAHHGGITADYLDQYKPELIIFHAHFSPLVPPSTPSHYADPAWFEMTITLKSYAEGHHYVLAAVFGVSPYDTHYYYVRPDFADSQALVRLISRFERYAWAPDGGVKAVNYLGSAGPQRPGP